MYPHTRWGLVAFGVMSAVFGAILIVRRPGGDALPPGDDSPGARLIGGLVLIAFGSVVALVGYNLATTGR